MATVKVYPHYRALLATSSQGYRDQLEALAHQVFATEPWGKMAAQMAVAAGTPPLPAGLEEVPTALAALSQSGMDAIAAGELKKLVALHQPDTRAVECHLFPCLNPERRGGFCFAPGKMLILIPLMDRWPERLVRNIVHEYSHTLRMARWPLDERHGFGPVFRYTIREHLVFEGLAESLVEQLHPDPDLAPKPVAAADERRFWDAVTPQLEKENWEAYGVLMNPAPGLPRGIGYAMGYQIVQRFLRRRGLTAVAAHRLPYEEIYWQSGYPELR